MKVLVIGFPKTGTKTLGAALQELGYNVYDFEENSYFLYKEWMKIFTVGGTREDFYRMYKDVDSACDTPPCLFWKEILEAFPDMKMIFMRRGNEDDWYRSLMSQFDANDSSLALKLIGIFSPNGRRFMHFCHYVNRVTFLGPSALPVYVALTGVSPTLAKMRYRQHNASILLEAPKAQTLEFGLSDGWEPLCKFLGKPIPDAPFPHKNKGGDIVAERVAVSPILKRMMNEAAIGFSLSVIAICTAGYFAYKHFPRDMLRPFSLRLQT